MALELPRLSIGTQSFNEIRLNNAVYVDKTGFIPELRKTGKVIFCARPRRFGKSLTCSTLDAYYSGKEELFRGLAAAKAMKEEGVASRPVIRLDMSLAATIGSLDILEEKILNILRNNAERHGVDLRGADSSTAFCNLIRDVSRKYSANELEPLNVVLLIDEYDSPIIKLVEKVNFTDDDVKSRKDKLVKKEELTARKKILADTRTVLELFYSQIKGANEYLSFVYITGVTKYSGMGVFSNLNNLRDITLLSQFGTFMGYTQEELESNFSPFIEDIARKLKIEVPELLKKAKDYYYGFSFDGKSRLYNPQSILNFLSDGVFFNYWMESGSNALVRKFILENNIDFNRTNETPFDINYFRAPGPLEIVSPDLYLYQAGYLTLRENGDGTYYLDYPNFEARSTMNLLFMENLYDSSKKELLAAEVADLRDRLRKGNAPELEKAFNNMFANVSYMSYVKMTRDKLGEFFFQNILMAFLMGAGASVTIEKHTTRWRIDLVVSYGGLIYVIEMKTAKSASDARRALTEGTRQVVKGNCVGPFSDYIVKTLALDEQERDIRACVYWRKGLTAEVNTDNFEYSIQNRAKKTKAPPRKKAASQASPMKKADKKSPRPKP